jgi:hypothetical protein
MALYQGFELSVFRKFRRYLVYPSKGKLSRDHLEKIGNYGAFVGCCAALLLSCLSGFNDDFMVLLSKKKINSVEEISKVYSTSKFMRWIAYV